MENIKGGKDYFNTSHVSINPGTMYVGNVEYGNFNTSHVSINLVSADVKGNPCLFQYISCFY